MVDFVENLTAKLSAAREQAALNDSQAKKKSKRVYFDRKSKFRGFKVGDQSVLVLSPNSRLNGRDRIL